MNRIHAIAESDMTIVRQSHQPELVAVASADDAHALGVALASTESDPYCLVLVNDEGEIVVDGGLYGDEKREAMWDGYQDASN